MVIRKNTNLVLVGFNTDYQRMEAEELSETYNVIHIPMSRFIYFILNKVNSDKITRYVVDKYYKRVRANINVENYAVVVTDDPIEIYATSAFESCDVRVLMRNSILNKKKVLSWVSDYLVYSFDPLDCAKYGFKQISQYIPNEKKLKEYIGNSTHFDFFFLGMDKGRKVMLDELNEHLQKLNYKTDFQLKYSPRGLWQKLDKWLNRNKKYKMLSYEKNLDMASRSKCIVEIVQEGQSGLTLRTLEALFLKKKLITNNVSVIDSELFNAANILYFETLEDLREDIINAFMERTYCDYPDEILIKHTITYNMRIMEAV